MVATPFLCDSFIRYFTPVYPGYPSRETCPASRRILREGTEPPRRRELTRTASHEYSLWLSRSGGEGYGSYFEWEP